MTIRERVAAMRAADPTIRAFVMARDLGCSREAVRQALEDLGLPGRVPSERVYVCSVCGEQRRLHHSAGGRVICVRCNLYCKKGHLLAPAPWRPSQRYCKVCCRMRIAQYRASHREAILDYMRGYAARRRAEHRKEAQQERVSMRSSTDHQPAPVVMAGETTMVEATGAMR